MKRKALITSTAILLVAIMCLATASYAWFTAGSASAVATINLSVSAGDTGLTIAAANAKAGTWAPGSFTTSAFSTTDLNNNGFMPADGQLQPVSTDGAFDGGYAFYEAPADTYNGTWGVNAAENDEYVLFSFYVKYDGETAENYAVQLASTTLFSTTDFINTCKIGYNVKDVVVEDGVVATTTPDALTIVKPATADATAYEPLVAANETARISKDASNKKFTSSDSSILGSTIADTAVLSNIPLNYTGAGVKLVTIAVWLEGQDYDCQGSLNVTADNLSVTLIDA